MIPRYVLQHSPETSPSEIAELAFDLKTPVARLCVHLPEHGSTIQFTPERSGFMERWHYTDVMTWGSKARGLAEMSSRGGEQVYYLKLTSMPPSIVRELARVYIVPS
jgi:hypothetical protein